MKPKSIFEVMKFFEENRLRVKEISLAKGKKEMAIWFEVYYNPRPYEKITIKRMFEIEEKIKRFFNLDEDPTINYSEGYFEFIFCIKEARP